MVESADTADLKSADLKRSWEFKSPSGHQGSDAPLEDSEKVNARGGLYIEV